MKLWLLVLISLMVVAFDQAQKPGSASGRWEATIELPSQKVPVIFEIAQLTSGTWKGEYTVPSSPAAQRIPLINVTVQGADVGFGLPGFPGYPEFKGKVATDGKAIQGNISIRGTSTVLNLERKGDSSLSTTPPSGVHKSETGKHAALEGTWEGTLDAAGTKLRLKAMLKSSGPELRGVLDSIDQNIWVPIDVVTINGSEVVMDHELIQGTFKGTLSQDGKSIAGTWEQGGQSFPLTLNKKM